MKTLRIMALAFIVLACILANSAATDVAGQRDTRPPLREDSALPPANAEADSEALDHITLTNGNTIIGQLEKISRGTAYIEGQFAAHTMRIPLDNIEKVRFAKPGKEPSPGSDYVLLPGGERLSGNLLEMSARTIRLETAYAGVLRLKRSMVDAIMLSNPPRVVFEDDRPGQSEKWGHTPGELPKHRMAKIEQKDNMTYDLDIELSNQASQIFFTFLGERPTDYWCHSSYWILLEVPRERGHIKFRRMERGTSVVESFAVFQRPKDKLKLRVAYDSVTRTIRIWASTDEPVMTLVDSFPRKWGSYVVISCRKGDRFDHMRITHQYSLYPEMRTGSEETDVVHHFESGTTLSGRVKSIDGEKIELLTNHGKSALDPWEPRVIVFSRKSFAGARRKPGPVELVLHNGDRLTVNVRALGKGVLTVKSPFAGGLRIERSAIREVFFNIPE